METVIAIDQITKIYNLYAKPSDRLKEALLPGSKSFHKDYYALKDISFNIKKGESVGIVGVNGSGKSTILKIITGVLSPTTGTIQTKGKIAALLELGTGFNPEYTGLENIYLNGTMMGYSEAEMKERVQPIVDFADIGEFIDQPVKTYSSGMFARLAFAVSINVEPDILIVDEALAVGDVRFQVKCINKMKELKDKGTTVLFVSHAVEQVKRFCDRTIWLDKGNLVEDGPSSHVIDLYENYMKYGDKVYQMENENTEEEPKEQNEKENMMAAINKIELNKNHFASFEPLEVKVEYEIFENAIEDFLLGVAIYSKDRLQYIFGPNTHLDQVKVPNTKGIHQVTYKIPRLMLMNGDYVIDVGIFNNGGLVNFDYKMSNKEFNVTNEYFSEGQVFMDHEWVVQDSTEEKK